jgi:hypothetical protein
MDSEFGKAVLWVAGLAAVLGGSAVVYHYMRRDPLDLVTSFSVQGNVLTIKYDSGPSDTITLASPPSSAAIASAGSIVGMSRGNVSQAIALWNTAHGGATVGT